MLLVARRPLPSYRSVLPFCVAGQFYNKYSATESCWNELGRDAPCAAEMFCSFCLQDCSAYCEGVRVCFAYMLDLENDTRRWFDSES